MFVLKYIIYHGISFLTHKHLLDLPDVIRSVFVYALSEASFFLFLIGNYVVVCLGKLSFYSRSHVLQNSLHQCFSNNNMRLQPVNERCRSLEQQIKI